MSAHDEIAALRAQHEALQAKNQALETRISVLETKTAAPKEATRPARPIEEGTRVTTLAPSATAFVKPSEAELRRLFDITLAQFQTLAPTLESFCAAFKALSYMGARTCLTGSTTPRIGSITAKPYLARSVTTRRFQWQPLQPPRSCMGIFAGPIGESTEACSGRPATDAWKRVLTGQFLAPTPLPRSRQLPPPSQVRVTTG